MADKPPGEIQTLIDNHIKFGTQNNELFLSVFGDTAVRASRPIAGRTRTPPPIGGRRSKVARGLHVSYENLSYEMGFWNVEGSNAYAVITSG